MSDSFVLPRPGVYKMAWSGRRFADGAAQHLGPVDWEMPLTVSASRVIRTEHTPTRNVTITNQWESDGLWAIAPAGQTDEARRIRLLIPLPLLAGFEWSDEYEQNGVVDHVRSRVLGPATVKVGSTSFAAIALRRQHRWSGRVEGIGFALEYMVPELGVAARDVMRGVTTIDGKIVELEEANSLIGLPEA